MSMRSLPMRDILPIEALVRIAASPGSPGGETGIARAAANGALPIAERGTPTFPSKRVDSTRGLPAEPGALLDAAADDATTAQVPASVAGKILVAFEAALAAFRPHQDPLALRHSDAIRLPGEALPPWMPLALSSLFVEADANETRGRTPAAPATVRARLRLESATLGTIVVDVSLQGERVMVDFGAARSEARSALRGGRPQLDAALAARGMRLAQLEVFHER
jgi:hypothetical protein